MAVTVRKAGTEDLSCLMQWRMRVLHEVFAAYQDVDWDALYAQNEAYYRVHIADGTHTACFAFAGADELIGCGGICYQTEMPSPDNPNGTCGYLMNIYTVPERRRQGVGSAIVEFLIADALAKNTGKIYLESAAAAKELYEGLGFIPLRDYYRR